MDLHTALDIQSFLHHSTYRNNAKIMRCFIARENKLMITPLLNLQSNNQETDQDALNGSV